jgi:glycosyltransferase involved in cell wall biosynthesis
VASQRRALEQVGHRVTVFSPPLEATPDPTPDPDPDVVELKPVPILDKLARILSKYNDFVFVWPSATNGAVIDEAFATRGPVDVVHVQGDLGVAVAGAQAARRHGIPVVQTKHSRYDAYFDQACAAPVFLAWVVSRMQRREGASAVTLTTRQESAAARLAWRFMVTHAQAVDHVIAPTRHFGQTLIERGVTQPVSVISNGIDDEIIDRAIAAEVHRQADEEPLRLVWFGRLSAEKRVLEAVEAVSRVRDCTLDIYGAGQLEESLRETVDSLGLSTRIRHHGWIGREQCLTKMKEADALLFTSYGFETQGMVLLEAATTSLPIIYCDPELVESVPDNGGLLAAEPSPAAIADAIATVAQNRAKLHEMVAALQAHNHVPRQSIQTEKILAIYRGLIDRR